MLDKNFDQYLRDRINNHPSDVPDDMWKKIIGEEEKDRKIFPLWRWWLAGAVLVALCLIKIAPAPNPSQTATVPHSPATAPTPSLVAAPTPPSTPLPPTSVIPSPITPTAPVAASTPSTVPAPSPSLAATLAPTPDPAGSSAKAGSPDPAAPTPTTSIKSDRPAQSIHPLPNPPHHNPPGPQSVNNNHNWYLEAMASPDWPLTSHAALSFTLGIRVIRTFGPRWSLITGLQYSRINLKYQSDSLSGILPHHYNNIDLPLLAGYHLTVAHPERLDPTINAGVVFNLYSSYVGQAGFYTSRGNIGLSLYLGLNLAQALTDRLSLFEEPYVRYQLSNMVANPYLPPQRISVAGVFLGIRYEFKKSTRLDCPPLQK